LDKKGIRSYFQLASTNFRTINFILCPTQIKKRY